MITKRKKLLILSILIVVLVGLLANRYYQRIQSDIIYKDARELYYEEKNTETLDDKAIIADQENVITFDENETIEEVVVEPIEDIIEEPIIDTSVPPPKQPKPEIINKEGISEKKNVVGWLSINGTNIDYPVVQTVDNDFYLNHNYLGDKNLKGSIYMDFRNDGIGEDRNHIIYGHKIFDGSMFSDLNKYVQGASKDKFFKENSSITFDNFSKEVEFKIFSAYVIDLDKEEYYLFTNYRSDEKFQAFIDDATSRSLVTSDIKVSLTDEIVTLVTCNYWYGNARVIVHAVRQ